MTNISINKLFINKLSQSKKRKINKTSKLIKLTKKSYSRIKNITNYQKIISSFYKFQNTIKTHLIHYNDIVSKRIEQSAVDYLQLLEKQDYPEIVTAFKHIDISYRIQENLLQQLKIKDLPSNVRYATEDMTRGLAKYISRRFVDSLPHVEMVSNGFIKLWECLTVFNVIPTNGNKGKFKVFHICEAPGQMILSAQHFITKKRERIRQYEWFANSLNPFNIDVKKKYGRVLQDTYGMIRKNPGKWLWGADNTGDITNVANVKWFRNRILGYSSSDVSISKKEGVDLIIGDGGLGSGNDAIVLQRLDLAQVVMVLACSRNGGACVIKHFTPYMTNHPESVNASSFFISYLYLYYLAFEEVSLFKPYSSDMTSGEFYVIGKGFNGELIDDILERVYNALDNFKVNNALFPRDAIPDSFVLQILGFIEQMADYNVIGYEKSNLVLTCYKELQKQQVSEDKKIKNKIKIEKSLYCNDFLNEDRIEEILVPRYNKWVRLYDFA